VVDAVLSLPGIWAVVVEGVVVEGAVVGATVVVDAVVGGAVTGAIVVVESSWAAAGTADAPSTARATAILSAALPVWHSDRRTADRASTGASRGFATRTHRHDVIRT
jgi:hypothetical protein